MRQREKHGAAGGRSGPPTPEYRSWYSMIQRCTNPKNGEYKNYGGRGITICLTWATSFVAFLRYVGPKPSKSHSLDRIDSEKGYEPGNVRWSTPKEQANNRRTNKILSYAGVKYTESQLLDKFWPGKGKDIARERLHSRLRKGWTVEEAIDTPPVGRGRKDVPCHLNQ